MRGRPPGLSPEVITRGVRDADCGSPGALDLHRSLLQSLAEHVHADRYRRAGATGSAAARAEAVVTEPGAE